MKILDEKLMKHLSFPDNLVEAMRFDSKQKTLAISIDGAWLDIGKGEELGHGSIFFREWDSITTRKYCSDSEKWLKIQGTTNEPLREICEIKFVNSTIILSGFGENIDEWIEWEIINPKMYAKFETLV